MDIAIKNKEKNKKAYDFSKLLSVKNSVVHCTNSTVPLAIGYVIVAPAYFRLLYSRYFYIHSFGPPCTWLIVSAQ